MILISNVNKVTLNTMSMYLNFVKTRMTFSRCTFFGNHKNNHTLCLIDSFNVLTLCCEKKKEKNKRKRLTILDIRKC